MKKFGVVMLLLCSIVQVHADQGATASTNQIIEPGHAPHYCRNADGETRSQGAPCPYDTTEVSSVQRRMPGGRMEYVPLGKDGKPVPETVAQNAGASEPSAFPTPKEADALLKESHAHLFKLLGFALVVGVIGKLLQRSFIAWFLVGVVLRMALVSAHVLAF